MPRSGRERKLRRKARKAEEAKAKSEAPIIETAQDIGVWNELEQHEEWVMPKEFLKKAPEAFAKIALNENGDHKDNTQIQAGNILVRMHGQNQAARKQQVSFKFNVHRHYEGRHTHAETPEADPEAQTPNEGNTVDAVAFREAVSDDEAAAVLEDLRELGLMNHLLGIEEKG